MDSRPVSPDVERITRSLCADGQCVLVTGASGFIGRRLVARLARSQARIFALSRHPAPSSCVEQSAGLRWIHGDLLDRPFIDRIISELTPGTVVHLGGTSIVDKIASESAYIANMEGTGNLARALARNQNQSVFILASTEAVYGHNGDALLDESTPPDPQHPYAASKLAAEHLLKEIATDHGMAAGALRMSNVYGGGDLNFTRLIPGAIRNVLNNEPPVLRSDGRHYRDFVHVDDVIDAILLSIDKVRSLTNQMTIWNVARGQSERLIHVVESIVRQSANPRLTVKVAPSDGGAENRRRISIEKSARELHWVPVCDLDTGLREAITWYSSDRSRVA